MRRGLAIALLTLQPLVFCAAVVLCCLFLDVRDRMRGTASYPTLTEISGETGLVFPASSRLRRSTRVFELMGRHIWAEVEMPHDEAQTLHETMMPGSVLALSADYRFGPLATGLGPPHLKPPWWWPTDAQGLGGSWPVGSLGPWVEVLIEPLPDRQAIVYLFWTSG